MHDRRRPPTFRSEQREVTLLFADLRGFTELAGSLETDPLVCELLAHVMDCLSAAVASHDGFIVDYYGDGLVAMWNAPTDQAEHTELACRAALRMLKSLPAVSDEWRSMIHSELRLGIGVHTGSVQVGNAGSTQKAKYGPRGPNVNLASRVESATKELHVPFVATQSTVAQLSANLLANRVCRAQMPGLPEPVELFVVAERATNEKLSIAWRTYDEALRQFEQGNLDAAASALSLIGDDTTGVPRRFLSERVENAQGRERRRRSTDKPAAHSNGVITLGAK